MRPSLPVLLLAVGGSVSGVAGSPATRKEPLRIQVPAEAGTAVRRAVLSAGRRLADPRCRLVLAEFRSAAHGRPLLEVLDLSGRTPAEHLASVTFRDGTGNDACASPSILAFTRPGSATVYVCARRFTRAAEARPAFAEVVLIHEMLHTLGLGENPPTSGEITARVKELCGDGPVRRAAARP